MVAVAGMFVGQQGAGGTGAPGERAGDIAEGDGFGDPVGHLVGVHGHVVGQVDHRLDDDVGVGAAAPVADGVSGDRDPGVLHPADPGTRTSPATPCAPDCWSDRCRCSTTFRIVRLLTDFVGSCPDSRVRSRVSLVAGQLADGEGAAYVEGLGRPEGGELGGAGADGFVEVEGVGQVELAVHDRGAGEGDLLVVDVEVPPVGSGDPPGFGFGRA